MGGGTPPVSVAGTASRWPSLAAACLPLAFGTIGAIESRHISVTHGMPVAWDLVLMTTMPRWAVLALALPLVLRLAQWVPVVPTRWATVSLHVASFFVLSLTAASVDTWAVGVASPAVTLIFGLVPRLMRSWYLILPPSASLYIAALIAVWGMAEAAERQRRTLRGSQLEAQLQAAKFAALRAQLQPHFLYNTLNGIAALVADVQPARAVAAIEQLGELLHASLRDDGRDMVSLQEEVGLAEKYLALQAMRFGDRLQYESVVGASAAECPVPVLLLQPIVENAVLHGLDAGHGHVRIIIRAMATAAGVEVAVENDGARWRGDGSRNGHGVGLAATHARLATSYGTGASLCLEPRDGGGVIVRFRIPRAGASPVAPPDDSHRTVLEPA